MPQPSVYVIVLNWNTLEETARCIDSVLGHSYLNYQILVVDNGSTGDSVAALRDRAPNVEVIALSTNTGYTGGNNIGMAHAFAAGADYVWLLNNDALAAPDTLAKLVETAETEPDIGLVSPVQREWTDAPDIHTICGHFDFAAPSTEQTDAISLARSWLAERPQRVLLYGAALLVRRALWEKIGGLDERFFAYFEDSDYSVRSIYAGFRNYLALDAFIYHKKKPTKDNPQSIKPHVYYYVARNEILFWVKYTRGLCLLKSIWWHILRQRYQINRMGGYQAGIDAILAGLWDGWRGVRGECPARQHPWLLRAAFKLFLFGRNKSGAMSPVHPARIRRPGGSPSTGLDR